MANSHVIAGLHAAGAPPAVRKIAFRDIKEALAKGVDDFMAMPSHLAFIGLIYPLLGIGLAALTFTSNALPLLFPLASGFALIGPLAAVGLYEISRRREAGEQVSWLTAFEVLRNPNIISIAGVGILLMAIFVAWVAVAQAIWNATLGHLPPMAFGAMIHAAFTTPEGQRLLLFGNAAGFVFALLVLVLTVVSVPMLIDRPRVGIGSALGASVQACLVNPVPMAIWGALVAVLLLLGSIPAFIGLAVVMPVLGHATWHLYKRVVT